MPDRVAIRSTDREEYRGVTTEEKLMGGPKTGIYW